MDNKIRVHLFASRNKDNKNVDGFKQRKTAFIVRDGTDISDRFDDFVSHGVPGEFCRHYASLNPRSEDKIREELTVRLIRNKPPVEKISGITASIACLPECAAEHKWLLDFDSGSEKLLTEFLTDVSEYFKDSEKIEVRRTVTGYAVIVPHGFDTRVLSKKWLSLFENKKDAMLFIEGKKKEANKS